MIGDARTIGIASDRILFGDHTVYRNVPCAPMGIPVWEFAARAQ
jgi:hypothetical protein